MAILEALKGWFNKSPKSASVILAVVVIVVPISAALVFVSTTDKIVRS